MKSVNLTMSFNNVSSSRTSNGSARRSSPPPGETLRRRWTSPAARPRPGGSQASPATCAGSGRLAAIGTGPSVYLLFHDVYGADPRDSGFRSDAADRYKLTVRQFEEQLSGLARHPAALPFALTFDDGGASFYTVIADRIEELGWRAHCFVPTDTIDRPGFLTRAQIQDLDRRGHSIGSHSASHSPRISACGPGMILREWTKSLDVLEALLGHEVVSASVPGGFHSRHVAEAAAIAGVRILFTSEPITRVHRVGDCSIFGRFTIRQASGPDASARLVGCPPWSRWAAWASWNSKGLIKPILGPGYARAADWLMAQKVAKQPLTTQEK